MDERQELFQIATELAEYWGRTQGQRAVLLKLLRIRFGELPDDVVAFVSQSFPEELEQYVERLVTATTLAEVFGEA